MTETRIYDMDEGDLASTLVGKSITATTPVSITLSDGTVLRIEDVSDCCAWFEGSVRSIDLNDNIVTGVRVDDHQEDDYGDEDYTITVLSASTELLGVDITGNPTSGYYCHSVNLHIITPEESSDA